MNNIARINSSDRKALFQNTAAKMGLTEAIVEKDYWVCFMLDYLFHRCKWKDDYKNMQNMIFGNKPEFQEIMAGMQKLENEMNSL